MAKFGNGIAFDHARQTWGALPVDRLRAEQGDAFLLVHTLELSESAAKTGDRIVYSELPRTRSPLPAVVVYVVKKQPGSKFDWVSVGRNDGNDIALPHTSVSRFHAMLRAADQGFTVQDARSANGTYLGPVRVPKSGAGAALPVEVGARLRFGDVNATFLDAQGLHAALQRAGPPTA